jgi:ATP-dependent DNA ligase
MASDKREFVNFKSFPGEIDVDRKLYVFPTLYVKSATGKVRQWTAYIRLIKKASKKASATKEQNWNLMEEDEVMIKPEYLNDDANLPEGTLAQLWTESGQIDGKISRCAPTYTDVKNKGKKNERNVFHQALVTTRGKYLKKLQEGSAPLKEFKELDRSKLAGLDKKYFPMLAKNYKDFVDKVKYPVYIQPKLDGLRCITYLDWPKRGHPKYTDVIMYSRQKKEYPANPSNDNIRKALLPALEANYDHELKESLYLDGEIYKHGKSLQSINSESRTAEPMESKVGNANSDEYHMYDMFFPSYEDEPFSERTEFLRELYGVLSSEYIKLVTTHVVSSKMDNDKLYHKYISGGYEGIIIRSPGGKYAKSPIAKTAMLRSKDLLKRKEVYAEEFEVVGFAQGSMGKDVGALIWVCTTSAGKRFNVTPNVTYAERYRLYKDCMKNFADKYQGKLMTVEFRGWSDDKIPQHAKATGFRDIV